MDRREFLGWVGVGALASYLPIAIAACSSDSNTAQPTPASTPSPTPDPAPRADGFLEVGTVMELDTNGSIENKQFDLIVVRNPENNNLSALNSLCTHQGCTVTWDGSTKKLNCPCHGSEFATDGKVLNPPAFEPLPSLELKEENGSIWVKVA